MNGLTEDLESKLQAQEKTIRVLSEQLERHVADNISAFTLFEQNIVLENAVSKRTQELDTQRKDLEQTLNKLKQTQAELLQAQKMQAVGQLAGGIAHEINTPAQYLGNNINFVDENFRQVLSALERIQAQLSAADSREITADDRRELKEALESTDLEFILEEVPQALEACITGVNRINLIVGAMKDFAQPSHGHPQPLDLNQLLHSILEISRAKWNEAAEVETQLEPELPSVSGLKDELGHVFINLIINGAHAIEDRKAVDDSPGLIRIVSRRNGEYAEVEIRDNGCGIAEELKEKIFEPFFTTKDVGRGVGQGLSIAYDVVTTKHHGQLLLDSEVGMGTAFTVRLPL